MTEVLPVEVLQVRRIGPTWEAADLRELIEDEEAAFAARLGTPTLLGPIIETIYGSGYGPIRTKRPIASLTSITDAGVDVLPYVRHAGNVIDVAGYWTAPIEVVYQPSDIATIRAGLIDLCMLRIDPKTVWTAVTGRDFSRSSTLTVDEIRERIYAGAMPGRGLGI